MTVNGSIIGYDPGGNDNHGLAIFEISQSCITDIQLYNLATVESVLDKIFSRQKILAIGK